MTRTTPKDTESNALGQLDCGCLRFCQYCGRDNIVEFDGEAICGDCASDEDSGELCSPHPASCFSGANHDQANAWERFFMCPAHAVEHEQFCRECEEEK